MHTAPQFERNNLTEAPCCTYYSKDLVEETRERHIASNTNNFNNIIDTNNHVSNDMDKEKLKVPGPN